MVRNNQRDNSTILDVTASLVSANLGTLIGILSIIALGFTSTAVYLHSELEFEQHDNSVTNGLRAQVEVDNLLHMSSSHFLRRRSQADPPPTKEQHANVDHSHAREGLSACLLVNDENPRLPEWLAYYYYTLPLRSLIIAIDPASQSSPKPILDSFSSTLGDLDITYWDNEAYFMPPNLRGVCDPNELGQDGCLWAHRQRQQHFVMKCMETFKRRGKSWVLLIDVDEYVTFNYIHHEDDPPSPLDEAPEGIATLKDWKVMHVTRDGRELTLLSGLLKQDGNHGTRVTTEPIITPNTDIDYGNMVEDHHGNQYFLYDDSLNYQDPTKMLQAPIDMPTITNVNLSKKDAMHHVGGQIYNDTYNGTSDGSYVSFPLEPNYLHQVKAGHIIKDARGPQYYFIENDQLLWPHHVNSKQALKAREDLPAMNSGVTVEDVLSRYSQTLQFGSCLQMPRLLYGSKEIADIESNGDESAAPIGFHDKDFVTLKYRWHGQKGNFDTNKYHKTMIDVSRLPMSHLVDKQAHNIHRPLTYYCRADIPRYSASLLRVNHYLDSYEAYTYRNDARGKNRKGCKECYLKKGKGSDIARDDDIRPWLKGFVAQVGMEKARILLARAGDFQRSVV